MPTVKLNNIRLHYDTFGEGDPLLLIMGLLVDHSGWKKQIEYFRDKYKVVVFDNRGTGLSDKPITPYTTGQMAGDAFGLLCHLGIARAHVVGISMGGMIAQELAIRSSEMVKKLVIANSYAKPLPVIKDFVRKNYSSKTIKNLTADGTADFFLKKVLSKEFIEKNPEIMQGMKENYLKTFSKIGFINQLAATQMHNTSSRLSSIKAPTLILCGEKDDLIPPEASKRLSDRISGSVLKTIKGGSHAMNWEQADQFNKAIESFLCS